MGKELSLYDVAADHPKALAELLALQQENDNLFIVWKQILSEFMSYTDDIQPLLNTIAECRNFLLLTAHPPDITHYNTPPYDPEVDI